MNEDYKNTLKKKIDIIVEDVIRRYTRNLPCDDEMIEYARMWPEITGLNVDLYIDDGGAHIRNGHPIWVYVVNNYNGDTDDVIKVPVDNIIQNQDLRLKISQDDFVRALNWIKKNKNAIKNFANGVIKRDELYKQLGYVPRRKNNSMINEMSVLTVDETDLPTEIWVDEGSKPKHGPRIKFKADSSQKISKNFSTMTISDNPAVLHLPENADISNKEIEIIKEFVKINKDLLILLANRTITREDFIAYMKKSTTKL